MSSNRWVNRYGPGTKVGNWHEENEMQDAVLKDFIAKKENGTLLIQRIQNILDTFLKKTELTVTKDGFVHFGDKVMVVNPGQEVADVPLTQLSPARLPYSLSINAEESMLYFDPNIMPPVDLSASRLLNPCKRNTFTITSIDGTPIGETLCFGQPFTISTQPGYTANLKLWSDHIRFNQRARKSKKQLVTFTNVSNYMCVWKVLCLDPQQRLETEGLPIPANTKVVIHHCKTGEKLSILDNVHLKTPFGDDFEVVACTHLDSHMAEKDLNHWSFVTGNPEDTPNIVEQRVKKNIDDDEQINKMQQEEEDRKFWKKKDLLQSR